MSDALRVTVGASVRLQATLTDPVTKQPVSAAGVRLRVRRRGASGPGAEVPVTSGGTGIAVGHYVPAEAGWHDAEFWRVTEPEAVEEIEFEALPRRLGDPPA